MKKLLFISLLANLVLVAILESGLRKRQTQERAEELSAESIEEAVFPGVSPVAAAGQRAKPAHTETVNSDQNEGVDWRRIESDDYKAYIANLRAIGCPEDTIAVIIAADLNKLYRSKLAHLRPPEDGRFKYWQSDMRSHWTRNPEYHRAMQEAFKEQRELFKELLGMDYMRTMSRISGWGWEEEDSFYKSLAEGKREQLSEVTMKFQELSSEIHLKARGYMDEDDQKALRKIEEEKEAALAKILSPEELFEYQVRTSDTLRSMQWNELQGFEVNEEEYRAIARAKLAEQKLGSTHSETGEKLSSEERSKRRKEIDEALRAALGEERFAEFQLNQNYEYRQAVEITQKLNLDRAVARQVYDMRGDVQKAANKVRSDSSLSTEERKEKLLAIQAETERTITGMLGEKGFKAYKRHAWWVRELSR